MRRRYVSFDVAAGAIAAIAVASAFAFACASFSGSTTPSDDGGAPDDGGSGAPEAAVDAPPDAPDDAGGPHVLYVMGGLVESDASAVATDEVFAATIAADGTLGAWEAAPKLPAPLTGAVAVALGDDVELVGGSAAYAMYGSGVLRSADPRSGWTATTSLPDGRYFFGAASDGAHIVVAAGKSQNNGDFPPVLVGTPGMVGIASWTGTKPYEDSLLVPGAAASNGIVVLAGGLDMTNARGEVRTAKIADLLTGGDAGANAPFGNTKFLSTPVAGLGLAIAAGHVYAIGGVSMSTQAQSIVQVATLGADGALGDFAPSTPLPQPRSTPCATSAGRFVYVIGGNVGPTLTPAYDSVYVGTVASDGTLVWATTTPLPSGRSFSACLAR